MKDDFKDYLSLLAKNAQEKIPEFCKIVDEFTAEWNRTDGPVTCELSTKEEFLHEKNAYLRLKSQELSQKDYVEVCWGIDLCDTCFGYHKEAPYHVEIRWQLK